MDIQKIACFNNEGETLDRYTIVILDNIMYYVDGQPMYECLASSANPFTEFGQHSDCMLGGHLGKEITFDELPEDVKKFVNMHV